MHLARQSSRDFTTLLVIIWFSISRQASAREYMYKHFSCKRGDGLSGLPDQRPSVARAKLLTCTALNKQCHVFVGLVLCSVGQIDSSMLIFNSILCLNNSSCCLHNESAIT